MGLFGKKKDSGIDTGLFTNKNANEVEFTGGRKHLMDVIKNRGNGDFLIYKEPEEDFNVNSTLIVNPGEMAIFVKSGQIEQVFENGTYKLDSDNYPFISRLRNAFTGGVSAFNCFVYFVKASDTVEIPWGTATPITVRDKVLMIATKLRARGAYKVSINDPAKFLMKMVGANKNFFQMRELNNYCSNEFQEIIRTNLTKVLNARETELLGIEDELESIAAMIEPSINDVLAGYGMICQKFSIAAIDIADSEQRARYDELKMNRLAKEENARADLGVMNILGQNWQAQQNVDIMKNFSQNQGSAGMAAGLGAGAGAAGVMNMMGQQLYNQMPAQGYQAPQQQAAAAAPAEDPLEVLGKLKKLLDAGLIEQAEYDKKKSEILSRM